MIVEKELIKAKIDYFANKNNELTQIQNVFQDLIKEHREKIPKYIDGEKYYENNNTYIDNKAKYVTIDGVKIAETSSSNNKIRHPFHRNLVDQKVNYLLQKPISISCKDQQQNELIYTILNETFDDTLIEIAKETRSKGVSYIQVYINEAGEFKYKRISPEKVIPIYNKIEPSKLDGVIILDIYKSNNYKETIKISYWDEKNVTHYIKYDNTDKYVLNVEEFDNANEFHFYSNEKGITYGHSWGKVPFIEFRNNYKKTSDLQLYKDKIDQYDYTISTLQDNLDDVQSLIYVLKGYNGQNLKEFMSNLQNFKAVALDSEGGLDTLKAEIPIEAVEANLNRIKKDIYALANGIDTTQENVISNTSGVALKFMYNNLDLAVTPMENKFKVAILELLELVYVYISLKSSKLYTNEEVQVTFNKSRIINDKEKLETLNLCQTSISQLTYLENIPFVTDVNLEIERIKAEKPITM
jgi:SPP1 family phage portal protein